MVTNNKDKKKSKEPNDDNYNQHMAKIMKVVLTSISLIVLALVASYFVFTFVDAPTFTMFIVFIFGALGGFISLQRSLSNLSEDKAKLYASSLAYVWLAPISGAVMAGMMYLLFLSNMLKGKLFPEFTFTSNQAQSLESIFGAYTTPEGYALLLIWSFVAGFNEKVLTSRLAKHFR